jgi:hypothetical protein
MQKTIWQLVFTISTLVTLIACGQPTVPTPALLETEPSVSIKVKDSKFAKGQTLDFQLVIKNPTAVAGTGIVTLISSASVSLDRTTFEVSSLCRGHNSI